MEFLLVALSIFQAQNLLSDLFDLIYMYKPDLVLNNLQCLICYETQPNQTKLFILFDF